MLALRIPEELSILLCSNCQLRQRCQKGHKEDSVLKLDFYAMDIQATQVFLVSVKLQVLVHKRPGFLCP